MDEETEQPVAPEEEPETVVDDEDDEILVTQHPWTPDTITYFGAETRGIAITGEIDETLALAISSQIQELYTHGPKVPITVQINTVGGSIIDALAIYDMLKIVECPIITIVNGGCFSAGLLIAVAGDIRLVTPNSMYFYHQPNVSHPSVNSPEAMTSMNSFYKWCKTNTDKIVRKRIGMSKRKWIKHFGNDNNKYFTAKKALKYGIATEILEFAEKPKFVITKGED